VELSPTAVGLFNPVPTRRARLLLAEQTPQRALGLLERWLARQIPAGLHLRWHVRASLSGRLAPEDPTSNAHLRVMAPPRRLGSVLQAHA
jgi:hypothetical protein